MALKGIGFIYSERRVRLDVFCEVQQEMWLWSAERVVSNGLKASIRAMKYVWYVLSIDYILV